MSFYDPVAPASVQRPATYVRARKSHDREAAVVSYAEDITKSWRVRVFILTCLLLAVVVGGSIFDWADVHLYTASGANHVVTSEAAAIATPQPTPAIATPTERAAGRMIREALHCAFSVSPDPDVTVSRLACAYRFIDGNALPFYQRYLAANMNARNPFVLAQHERVVVTLVRVSPIPPDDLTYRVLWSETEKEVRSGTTIATPLCGATLTIAHVLHTPAPASPAPGLGPVDGDDSVDASLDNPDMLVITDVTPVTTGVASDDCGLIV